jgi:lipid II isoglutaminyl synthase (glutamine-hydrolysing)
VIGGRATLLLDPLALSRLASGRRSVLVSGTNGKTTTNRLLRAALATAGPVVSNSGGANLPYGLVAALSTAPPGAALAALEVDEAYLGPVASAVRPEVICLLNLSRDQLDRINEVRMLAGRWRQVITEGAAPAVVANADDPMVVWAAEPAPHVVWVAAGLSWTMDATGCPRCEGRIRFSGGSWECGDCGFARPRPAVVLDDVSMTDQRDRRIEFGLSLPGWCNRANAAVAASAASFLGVDEADGLAAMATVAEVTGRYGRVRVGGIPARLLLSKNPAGWMEIFDFLAPPPAPVVVSINARLADGRDPSWLWDVPFERLAGRRVVASGERCRDLAVRLKYAEIDHVMVEDPVRAVAEAARAATANGTAPGDGSATGAAPVDVVGNYTAFQELRRAAVDGDA